MHHHSLDHPTIYIDSMDTDVCTSTECMPPIKSLHSPIQRQNPMGNQIIKNKNKNKNHANKFNVSLDIRIF